MPADRYFTREPLAKGGVIELIDKEHSHLARVMRAQPGDSIEVVNGKGELGQGRVVEIGKKGARIEIEMVAREEAPKFRLAIYQGIPRQNRLDTVMEKCTELGMTDLYLFPAVKSERLDLNENQLERCENVLIAAMKQSGSLWLPKLTFLGPIGEWKSLPLATFHGDLSADAKVLTVSLREVDPKDGAAVIIGPEAGLTKGEEKKVQSLGSRGVKLHMNVLRTDTAPIVALSMICGWLMER